MDEILIGALLSVLTGVAVWAVLPRGVVLTREPLTQGHDGTPIYDTWRIRNNSALPVRITSVTHSGIHTHNAETGEIEVQTLPYWVPQDETDRISISLSMEDEVAELTRDADETPWRKVIVPPGDTLRAYVNLNRTLTIKYRRAGWLGIFERRTVKIDGGV